MRSSSRSHALPLCALLVSLACVDEAAQEQQARQAVIDAADDPWLDAIGNEDDEGGAPTAPAAVEAPGPTGAVAPGAVHAPSEGPAPGEGAAPPEPSDPSDPSAPANAPGPAAAHGENRAVAPTAHPTATPDASEDPGAATPPADPNAAAPLPEPAEPTANVSPSEPEAQPPAPITLADFNGSYRYVGGSAQRQGLADSIEAAAMTLPGIIRGIGRKRLTKTNPLDDSLSITVAADKVTTAFASGFNPTATLGGGQVSWVSKKGDKYKVKVQQKGSKLIQIIAGEDGVKTTVFVLSSDRTRLTVHHKIVAERLSEPMTYKLSYARK